MTHISTTLAVIYCIWIIDIGALLCGLHGNNLLLRYDTMRQLSGNIFTSPQRRWFKKESIRVFVNGTYIKIGKIQIDIGSKLLAQYAHISFQLTRFIKQSQRLLTMLRYPFWRIHGVEWFLDVFPIVSSFVALIQLTNVQTKLGFQLYTFIDMLSANKFFSSVQKKLNNLLDHSYSEPTGATARRSNNRVSIYYLRKMVSTVTGSGVAC